MGYLWGSQPYNRGTQAIGQQIDAAKRAAEFELMDIFNSLPKFEDAGKPFGLVQIVSGNGGFWIECPKSGFGFWYPTLWEIARRWKVALVGFDCGVWACATADKLPS